MVDGVYAGGGGWGDADDFGRKIRRFALDAHAVLGRPDSPLDELIGLHGRVWHLLQEPHAARSTAIRGWLLGVRREIGDRLQSWSVEELESLVA